MITQSLKLIAEERHNYRRGGPLLFTMRKLFVLLSVAILLLSGCRTTEKLNERMTIKDLQNKEPRYEKLDAVRYYTGGGMDGSIEDIEIFAEDGRLYGQIRELAYYGIPTRVRRYLLKDEVMKDLEEYVRLYNLSIWDELEKSELIALDAPTTSYTLTFNDGDDKAWVNISDDLILPEGAYDILKGLLKLMRDHISNGQLIDAYQGDLTDDKQIHVARQITNTAEEIEFLLHGHWHNGQYYIEIDDDELKTGFNDETDNGPYHLKQTVNEPYKDYDCGFYRVYENYDRHLYLLLQDFMLIIEDDEGRTFILDR